MLGGDGIPQKPVFGEVCVQYETKIVGWEDDMGPVFEALSTDPDEAPVPIETGNPAVDYVVTGILHPDGPYVDPGLPYIPIDPGVSEVPIQFIAAAFALLIGILFGSCFRKTRA